MERAKAEDVIAMQPGMRAVIDDALLRFRGRSLVSGTEVVDFLLDLRCTVDQSADSYTDPEHDAQAVLTHK